MEGRGIRLGCQKVVFWGVDTMLKARGSHRKERRKFCLKGNKFKKGFFYSWVESPTESIGSRWSTWSHKKGSKALLLDSQPNTAMVISKENSAGGPSEAADVILSQTSTPEGGLGRRHRHSHLFSATVLSAFLWTGFFSSLLRTPSLLGNLSWFDMVRRDGKMQRAEAARNWGKVGMVGGTINFKAWFYLTLSCMNLKSM